MDHGSVADVGLLKAHGNATEVLEFTKEILYQVPPLVHLRVVVDRLDTIRPGRNHRHRTTLLQLGTQLVAVVGAVRNQRLKLDIKKQGRDADQVMALTWQQHETHQVAQGVYVIDSFPVAVCDNIRIRRAKLYRDETCRGYQASKRRYFYGLKIHLMVTSAGQPVECVLTPGSVADARVLKSYAYDLPPG